MRRIATIIIMTVVVLALGSVAYGYVANQRGLWPFHSATITAATSSFSSLADKDLVAYAYFDLSNPNVASRMGNNPQLIQNLNLLKTGFKQLTNSLLQDSTPMVFADDATRQEITSKVSNLLDYLSSKKIHIAWAPNATPATQISEDIAEKIFFGIEIDGADDANHTLVTLKSFMGENDQSSQEIRISNQPVSVITSATATPQSAMSMYVANINNKILVITQNQQGMESVIQRSMSESTETFAGNSVFTSLLKKVTGPQLGMIYLNNKQYLTAVNTLSSENTIQSQGAITNTLLENPAYQSSHLSSFTLNDKGLYMEGYTAFDDPQFAAQLTNSSSSFATAVPNDTLFFEEGHNLTQLFNMYVAPLLSALESEFTSSDESPMAAIEAFEDATQISIANDIAPLFTKTSALALHRADSFLVPVALTILTEITNQASAEATMAKLANALIATVSNETGVALETPSSENIDGTTIHSAGQFQGVETLLNYAFIQNNNSLVISSSKSAITTVLDILKEPTISLARSPKYPEILKNAPASNSMIYLDIKSVVDGFLPLLSLSFDSETANLYATQVKPHLDVLNNFALYNVRDGDTWKSVAQLQIVN